MTPAPFAKRLLVGLDGRDPDVRLIRYASMVARLNPVPTRRAPAGDAEVRFVYLFPHGRTPSLAPPTRVELRSQVNRYFTRPALADGPAHGGDVAIGYDVLKGHAWSRLPDLAADFDSDLLLLGQSTRTQAASARIAAVAPCPVWTVPPDWAPVLRRLLVPCDFTDRSAAALRAAVEIARQSSHSKCYVLHAYWTTSRFTDDRTRREALGRLREAYGRFLAGIDVRGVEVEPAFVEGTELDREIQRAVEELRIDLVIASSRGRTPTARMILPGRIERAVRRCRSAVLVLRTPARPVGLVQSLRESLARPADLQFS